MLGMTMRRRIARARELVAPVKEFFWGMARAPGMIARTKEDGCNPRPAGQERPSAEWAPVWRWLPAGVALLAWVALAIKATDRELSERAKDWFDWMTWPPFSDLQVMWAGIAAHAQGTDPLLANELSYNYPRLWLVTSGGGLHGVPLVPAALGLVAAFLIFAIWMLRVRSRREATVVSLLLVSPAVTLALERANTDLAIFVLVGGSIAYAPKANQFGRGLVTVAALLLAGMLKLYPAIALAGGVVFSLGRRRVLFGAAVLAFALYAASHLTELGLIAQKTQRDYHASYGTNVLGTGFRNHFFEDTWSAESLRRFDRLAPAMSLGFYLALLIVAARRGWRAHADFAPVGCDDRTRAWFWAGALIYCGSFALGNCFVYRLIFLLPCLPFIRAAANTPSTRRWAIATFAALFVTMMKPLSPAFGWFLLFHPPQWVLALLLAGGVTALGRCAISSDSGGERQSGY